RTALDRASSRIGGKFKARPLVEASIRQTMGQAYSNLGQYRSAQREFEHVLELCRRVLGEEHPSTINTMFELALTHTAQLNYEQAELLLTKGLELSRHRLGKEHQVTIGGMSLLGLMYQNQGNYTQAEELSTKALELS